MNSDLDRILNRLVAAALTVFVTVSLLLAAVVAREIWLQQQIADLNSTLQADLDDLSETTGAIQSEVADLRTATGDAEKLESLGEVTELLNNVDEQLGAIEENVGEVASVLGSEPETATVEAIVADDTEPPQAPPDRADQVFTIFAALIGVTALVIALLLGIATHVQERTPPIEGSQP